MVIYRDRGTGFLHVVSKDEVARLLAEPGNHSVAESWELWGDGDVLPEPFASAEALLEAVKELYQNLKRDSGHLGSPNVDYALALGEAAIAKTQ